jgi:hypothetical protein
VAKQTETGATVETDGAPADPRKQLAITAPQSWLTALQTHVTQTGFDGSVNVWVGELVGRTIGVPFPPVSARSGGTVEQRKTKAASRKASDLLAFLTERGADVAALEAFLASQGLAVMDTTEVDSD